MFTSSRNQENANKNHNELWSPTVRPVAGSQRGQRWWQWGENLRRHLKIDHVGLGGKWKKGGSHKLFLDFPERAMRPWTEIRKLKQGRPRGLDARRRWRTVGRNCWYGVKSAETGLPPPPSFLPQVAGFTTRLCCTTARLPLAGGADQSKRRWVCPSNFLRFHSFEPCVQFVTL